MRNRRTSAFDNVPCNISTAVVVAATTTGLRLLTTIFQLEGILLEFGKDASEVHTWIFRQLRTDNALQFLKAFTLT
jgi:hypothetical protein